MLGQNLFVIKFKSGKFRIGPVALVTDIEKAFVQITIIENNGHAHSLLGMNQ